MSDVIGTCHLRRPALSGPAERIVVELWLSELTGLMLNGYPEAPAPAAVAVPDGAIVTGTVISSRGNVLVMQRPRMVPADPLGRAA